MSDMSKRIRELQAEGLGSHEIKERLEREGAVVATQDAYGFVYIGEQKFTPASSLAAAEARIARLEKACALGDKYVAECKRLRAQLDEALAAIELAMKALASGYSPHQDAGDGVYSAARKACVDVLAKHAKRGRDEVGE